MYRFLLYLLIAYVLFFIIRTLLRIFRGGTREPQVRDTAKRKTSGDKKYDKSKAVDADFEELQ